MEDGARYAPPGGLRPCILLRLLVARRGKERRTRGMKSLAGHEAGHRTPRTNARRRSREAKHSRGNINQRKVWFFPPCNPPAMQSPPLTRYSSKVGFATRPPSPRLHSPYSLYRASTTAPSPPRLGRVRERASVHVAYALHRAQLRLCSSANASRITS